MKIKTSELTGAALDWAVAKCEGVNAEAFRLFYEPTEPADYDSHKYPEFHYSTIWAQGGPIIEREKLSFCYNDFDGNATPPEKAYIGFIWNGHQHEDLAFGETPLIAAMRCYVASKLGDEVEVPDELKGE